MLFAIGCYVFALIALIATGFPESRGESLVAAIVFAGLGALIQLGPRVIAKLRGLG